MITVYYKKVFPLQEDTFLRAAGKLEEEKQLNKIEEKRREKIFRIRSPKQRQLSLAAGVLLHDALCKVLGVNPEETPPFALQYEERGKPYLLDDSDIHFNLSHSGEYVCCAIGSEPVGVDIQEKLAEKEKVAERFFTLADKEKLLTCGGKKRKDLFFRMWSIKESYVKLTGEGLSRGLTGFEIDWQKNCILEKEKNACAYFQEKEIVGSYCLCVCSHMPQKVIWKEVAEKIC